MKQASLFGNIAKEANLIYPKRPAGNYERYIERFYFLKREKNSRKEILALEQKEWNKKSSKGRNAEELKSFIKNNKKKRVATSKKVLKDMVSSPVNRNEKRKNPSTKQSLWKNLQQVTSLEKMRYLKFPTNF